MAAATNASLWPCCVFKSGGVHAHHIQLEGGCSPPLAFLSPKLHLMTYLVADDHVKLRHWLRHYLVRLGVWANHTRIVLRMRRSASGRALNATLAAAAEFGVPPSNMLRQHSPPSDTIKMALMNAHLASLADSDWHIYADVDEHFDYPCELQHPPHVFNCVMGKMWDQLSDSGAIAALTDEPDITEQYPRQCRIRARFPHMMPDKVIMVHKLGGLHSRLPNPPPHSRLSYSTHSTHRINGTCLGMMNGWIRHYTMTAQNMESQRQKAALQQQQLDTGLHPQKELAMPCANVNRSGHCLDYLMQYDWMRKQDAVSRGALTLEQARHHRPECVWSLRKMERLQLDRKPA